MTIVSAHDSKENSIKNAPKKSLQQLREEIAAAIKNCSDAGYFNAGFLIPANTSDKDKEAILVELNAQKYSLDSNIGLDGLHLNIKWDKPLP